MADMLEGGVGMCEVGRWFAYLSEAVILVKVQAGFHMCCISLCIEIEGALFVFQGCGEQETASWERMDVHFSRIQEAQTTLQKATPGICGRP